MFHAFSRSMRYYLEIRYPERGRKPNSVLNGTNIKALFGNKIPREGTETFSVPAFNVKPHALFGNKIPREGTETEKISIFMISVYYLEIRYPERGRKLTPNAIVESF